MKDTQGIWLFTSSVSLFSPDQVLYHSNILRLELTISRIYLFQLKDGHYKYVVVADAG